ncbi:MAG TPA: tRNA (adenosine(37)-N6)-dimethylallyltransferase MiaA [Lentisphaeria bacterium]|nr:MAG: tRNA (adenosine(37)-N6)-dimethylallyltransferase MiaA [Lentisphaerae bacterium GWF2_38_69]HBM17373.1 tRNA (adenosine(37)-N6)-dimethylallyltransferase MiaA [Lentisphaeria bacterium]
MKDKPIVVIMGPTSSGKSDLALDIARKMPAEIISADSMQLYVGMDIGTAKPSREEQRLVRHHLLDFFDISERFEVFTYVKLASEAIADIQSRNKIPLIVGGSGMYIKALLYGLDPLPSDQELSKNLYGKYENDNLKLINDLAEIDPNSAELFREKTRKMIRAMEVFILTGKSILEQNTKWDSKKMKYSAISYKIKRDRKDLFERISLRTDRMLSEGWIEETEKLIQKGLNSTPTARQAIGYGLIGKYLDGQMSFEELRMRIIADTKKFARRQETWFNNQHPEAKEFFLPDDKEKLLKSIIERYSKENN